MKLNLSVPKFMKKSVLLVSFDIRRSGEPEASFAVAPLKASLISHPGIQAQVKSIESISIGVRNALCSHFLLHQALHDQQVQDWEAYDTIAVSAYVWSDDWTKKFISMLRKEGYKGKIVLGGYQVSYSKIEDLVRTYPESDLFLGLYAETSIVEAVLMERPTQPLYLNNADHLVDFNDLPSLYASGIMPVSYGQGMVRMETKRGCSMRCTFCQYRDLGTNKVHKISRNRMDEDLAYLSKMNVGKINFTDAIFNIGDQYLSIVKQIKKLEIRSQLSFQIRPEYLTCDTGKQFLDMVSDMNVVLEFGFQTSIPVENDAIQRHNDYNKITRAAELVNVRSIPFEVSLIYGLPHQTPLSFQKSIDYSLNLNPNRVVAYPLMLYKGTPMYEQKEEFGYQEEVIGDFNIPVVISSKFFSRSEWGVMHDMAERLNSDSDLRRVI